MGAALAGLGLALGKAVQSASEFETAMVEVEKVTNPETAAEMSEKIREMASTIPIAQTELAGLTADAARFGIRGSENIESFVESVGKMAIATDLSATQAGESFAKLAQLTSTPIDQIENLGSAINTLSNTSATSSSEIVDSMLRSSAALNQFGLNQREIAGMTAAINEVSESSRRAGTRLRRVAQELMNPKKVGDIAEALGMNVEEFKRMRKESPIQIFRQLAEAMNEGGAGADQLRKNLSTASRQAIAGLGQNLDGLNQALSRSESSFKENTSLQREFEAASDTLSARMQVLQNRLGNVAIAIGNRLLPHVSNLVDSFNDFIGTGEDVESTVSDFFSAIEDNTALTQMADTVGGVVGQLQDMGDELGEIIDAHSRLSDSTEDTNESLSENEKFWIGLKTTVVNAVDFFTTSISNLVDVSLTWMRLVTSGVFGNAASIIFDSFMIMMRAGQALTNTFQESLGAVGEAFSKVLEGDIPGAVGALTDASDNIQGEFDQLADEAGNRFESITESGEEMKESITSIPDETGMLLERMTARTNEMNRRRSRRRAEQFFFQDGDFVPGSGRPGGRGGSDRQRRPGATQMQQQRNTGSGAGGGGGGQQTVVEVVPTVKSDRLDDPLAQAVMESMEFQINQRVQSSQRREFDRLQGRGDFA